MKEYLEQTLREPIHIEICKEYDNQLPLVFQGRYFIYKVDTNGIYWIFMQPKKEEGLVTFRKDWMRLKNVSKLNCALFLENTSFYIKEKLLEDGIPYVLKNKVVYLPFLGYLLEEPKRKNIAPVHILSYLTQKLLFIALYDRWEEVTVSKAAIKLNVSKMSMSRCFDEIEFLHIDVLSIKGKSRVITVPSDIQQLWIDLQKVIRNPIIKRYELKEDIHLKTLAGMSALSEFSLISDNVFPTYAITKKEISSLQLNKKELAYSTDEIGCVILELGYLINFKNRNCQDPLSIVASMNVTERQDERINISIEEMLKEYVW